MKLSIPTNFNRRILNELNGTIYETYGNLNTIGQESIVANYALPTISKKKLHDYVAYSHDRDIEFNYILSHPSITPTEPIISLLDYLKDIEVDTITASNLHLIQFIKKNYPFKLSTSIVSEIQSIESAKPFIDMGCDIICIDSAANTNYELITALAAQNISVKLLANNICIPNCRYKKEHLSTNDTFERNSLKCLQLKMEDLALVKSSGFISPNTLNKYEEIGCDIIKLGGRSKPTDWIIKCAKSYLAQEFQGNHFPLTNSLGAVQKCSTFQKNLFSLLPGSVLQKLSQLLYLITKKKIYKTLGKEKNIKNLLNIFSQDDIFYIDQHTIKIDRETKQYLTKEIEIFLTS